VVEMAKLYKNKVTVGFSATPTANNCCKQWLSISIIHILHLFSRVKNELHSHCILARYEVTIALDDLFEKYSKL